LLKLYTSWFAFGFPAVAHHYFERRRAATIAQLAAVTRQIREGLDAGAAR
jgi:hypothetical protein